MAHDATLDEALAFRLCGVWQVSYTGWALPLLGETPGAVQALADFHQLAHDGALQVWGRSRPDGVLERIPARGSEMNLALKSSHDSDCDIPSGSSASFTGLTMPSTTMGNRGHVEYDRRATGVIRLGGSK
jgi:hypothetical protein